MVDLRDLMLSAGEAARDRDWARERGGGIAIPGEEGRGSIVSDLKRVIELGKSKGAKVDASWKGTYLDLPAFHYYKI